MIKESRRHLQASFISLVLVLLSGCSVANVAQCTPRPSELDRAIGTVELGATRSELPAGAVSICDTDSLPGCRSVRIGAVSYVDEGDGLILKAWQIQSMYANEDVLPFGLSKFDKTEDVLRKMKPHWKTKLSFENDQMEDGTAVDTGLCFINGLGKLFGMRVTFLSWGQIETMETYTSDWREPANP